MTQLAHAAEPDGSSACAAASSALFYAGVAHKSISHVTSDDIAPEAAKRVERLYERTTAPGAARSRAEIARFFEGLELIPPGLVNVASWRAEWMATGPGRTIFYAGVGSKE